MESWIILLLSLWILFSTIAYAVLYQIKIDAAYQRGIADAKQATTEVISDIKIKVSESKSLHDAATEISNEMNRRLKKTNTM